MVLTHKKVAEEKAKPIIFKATDPRRLTMPRDQVMRENEIAREKARKLREAEEKINQELGISNSSDKKVVEVKDEPAPVYSDDIQKILDKKANLEEKYSSIRGPGSKQKREQLAKEIRDLEASLPADMQV